MTSGMSASHQIATLLRGESETISAWSEVWNARRFALHITVIVLGAGCYGAAVGWWRDPQQALYVAIKFPLIILLTTLGNALINGMLAPLLGLNIPFRQSFSAIVMSFTIATAILGAFSPLIAFLVWNAPPMTAATLGRRDLQFHIAGARGGDCAGRGDGEFTVVPITRATGRRPHRRVTCAVGLAGRQSFSRQPALLDFAAVHRLARCRWNFFARRRFMEIFSRPFFIHSGKFSSSSKSQHH